MHTNTIQMWVTIYVNGLFANKMENASSFIFDFFSLVARSIEIYPGNAVTRIYWKKNLIDFWFISPATFFTLNRWINMQLNFYLYAWTFHFSSQ